MTKKGNSKKRTAEVAMQHIENLFVQASHIAGQDENLATRYVVAARKIAMKFKLHIPSKFKRRFCKHCYRYLIPGKSLRVRVRQHRLIYYCLHCKNFWRKPLHKNRE